MSCQIYTPADEHHVKNSQCPFRRQAGWIPEPVWTVWRKEQISAPVRNQTPILRSRSPLSGLCADWNNPILIGKLVLLKFHDGVADSAMMFTPRYFSWSAVSCYRPIEHWLNINMFCGPRDTLRYGRLVGGCIGQSTVKHASWSGCVWRAVWNPRGLTAHSTVRTENTGYHSKLSSAKATLTIFMTLFTTSVTVLEHHFANWLANHITV